jgi:hypothetical protein
MLVNRMAEAWKNRSADAGAGPATPAGASPLDEINLDAIVGGATTSVDFFTFVCTSSVPPTLTCTQSGCTA